MDLDYDEESDSLYINIRQKKAYVSVEFGPGIAIDLTQSKEIVGVEILDASVFVSELFSKKVSREQVSKLFCEVSEKKDMLGIKFQSADKHYGVLVLPKAYGSPILSAC
ncbi:hypothetical protein COT30_02695 [Candidatus Micrarchaeota archaeon CG08_land_8_20_14_0_20_49_17]|nr:MAG: hypothetical protein COT30_02695 [Candidatus Micrarchaeota archaeon CG08_land_8_20_14_0_20_49_17]PIU82539.1 MAG: hypothetical protein COS70_00785 [Candidatus Micrarchaeota archaeon CG06_land_8_20_14_3_00_50_6]PIZ96696.1 MAG: hypothetical protein COX84_03650 [Candidatus Micrarchaeota archaeon CG_4_10_14_0_2_um_filter_49_7]HII53239.1 DUF2283 domain-containing protein [Candidatus Micrarchaeota archaeon]